MKVIHNSDKKKKRTRASCSRQAIKHCVAFKVSLLEWVRTQELKMSTSHLRALSTEITAHIFNACSPSPADISER